VAVDPPKVYKEGGVVGNEPEGVPMLKANCLRLIMPMSVLGEPLHPPAWLTMHSATSWFDKRTSSLVAGDHDVTVMALIGGRRP
jgi:hypothetical protein